MKCSNSSVSPPSREKEYEQEYEKDRRHGAIFTHHRLAAPVCTQELTELEDEVETEEVDASIAAGLSWVGKCEQDLLSAKIVVFRYR